MSVNKDNPSWFEGTEEPIDVDAAVYNNAVNALKTLEEHLGVQGVYKVITDVLIWTKNKEDNYDTDKDN